MRVAFMGTPDFAVPSLRELVAHHDVVAVFTRPDAASGRGRTLRATPVKAAAEERGLLVLQPATLKDPAVVTQLRSLAPDVLVVAAYGLILPQDVLAVAPHGAINVHASLLPRWRGAAPIERAILAGDQSTGVSIMAMEEGLDTGPFCRIVATDVADKTASELSDELAVLGAQALLEALDDIAGGTCAWVAQDPARVTYAEKIGKGELLLAPDMTRAHAHAAIRASSGRAPARLRMGESELTVTEAERSPEPQAPGTARCVADGILFGFADGAIIATRVKPQGRAEMDAPAFCRGAHIELNARWERITDV